ncbi:MAG: hypothetical protein H6912_02990 [Kordiimonadaceae bacterium]|nr:hypothetical protein [Kordiimonadaceae bacterium]
MFKSKSYIFFLTLFLVHSIFMTTLARSQNYEPWTGAVVGARIDFSKDDALDKIRKLINEGDTIGAVREANKIVSSLAQIERGGAAETIFRYDAYNAYCISLTANKEYEKAMEACNEAIKQLPSRWQAFNSRGSLNYKTENFKQALSDYQSALGRAPDAPQIKRLLEHNIKIAEVRVSGN